MSEQQPVDFSRVESNYIRNVLGEPLHHGLRAITLYRPLDPIDFLANYLRYWVKHVRNYRREKIAEKQSDWLLTTQLPWNVSVIAEQAKKLEQDQLDESRRIAAKEARKAALERARIKVATEVAAKKSSEQIQTDVSGVVFTDASDKVIGLAIKKYEEMERKRRKAEELVGRRAQKEEKVIAGMKAEGGEDMEEVEEEE
ncbi:uncharacterized protein DEA37_0007995 [Paragonimus westermani]|uniref:Uncharacterized protein n=1 Tax=Paragonimus westermani TaxID=34504 RepID=A0A5J4NJU8_9TREM|nr:uncharacterized protein DEA37_0007995 [Paragonimus westermani]